MKFQRFIILCCLLATSQSWAMKSTLQKYGLFQRSNPLSQTYNTVSASLAKYVPTFTKFAATTKQKSFEFVKPVVGAWHVASLPLRSDMEKIDFLFKALEDKTQGKKSSVYSHATLEELIQKIAKKDFINSQNSQGSTPLDIILNVRNQNVANSLILLEQSGANLHDQKALDFAVKSNNAAALKVLRPHFNTNEVSEYMQTIQHIIQQRQEEVNQLPGGMFTGLRRAEIATCKKLLAALEQKPKKMMVKVQATTVEGKESELTFEKTYEEYLPKRFNEIFVKLKATFSQK